MFDLHKLLDLGSITCNMDAASRKRALQLIAELVADEHNSADYLFDELMARERLGSTGLGEGVAIPHCRIECQEMRAAFVSLPEPIDYEASDGEPVDLLFTLIVPTTEQHAHLEALAALSGVFADAGNRRALRACKSAECLMQTLSTQLADNNLDAQRA
jgi:nitrogen PTS system EIIA component